MGKKYKTQYAWKVRNPDKVKEINKEWRAKNKDYPHRYYQVNRERILFLLRKHYKKKVWTEIKCKTCNKSFIPCASYQVYCCVKCRVKVGQCALRFQVLLRDNFTCLYCGRKPPEVILEVDHIYPKGKGGKNHIHNLITACRECNRGKQDIPLK